MTRVRQRFRPVSLLTAATMNALEHDPIEAGSKQEQDMTITQTVPNPISLDLSQLSQKSRRCIERLLAHEAESLDLCVFANAVQHVRLHIQ